MISIGLYNKDSSFFNIESTGSSVQGGIVGLTKIKPDRVSNEDVISFNYTEEMGRYNSGTISLNDPNHVYSNILRVGTSLNISFGYMNEDLSGNAALLAKKNPSQVLGANVRENIRAVVQSPNGTGSSDGRITFNCNFMGGEYLNNTQRRVHVGMTKGVLVQQLLEEIGVESYLVNFSRQGELLDANTQIFQRETNYRLLLRFSREWRTIFRISYNSKGQMTAVFISPSLLKNSQIASLMSGAIGGSSIFLEYKSGVNNVIEYNWKNNAGESGSGDNVRIVYGADGKPTFLRYVTEDDKVKVYQLNTERIRKELEKKESIVEKAQLTKEYLSQTEFSKVKKFFDEVEIKTAPQGLGYSMDVKMLGNPLTSAPLTVLYGEGFPRWFSPTNEITRLSYYYCNKVTHAIDRSGYKMDLKIADAFTLTGGSLI